MRGGVKRDSLGRLTDPEWHIRFHKFSEADVCVATIKRADFDVFLLAGRYTLLEQQPLDTLFPLCESRSISVLLGGVFNRGILAAWAIEGAHHNYGAAAEAVVARVRQIESICGRHDEPISTVGRVT